MRKVQDKDDPNSRLKLLALSVEDLLPDWAFEKFTKSKAESERRAWAAALKKLRNLEREGYDVFAGFQNAEEIQAYIAIHLYTYEIAHRWKKLFRGDLKALDFEENPPKAGQGFIRKNYKQPSIENPE